MYNSVSLSLKLRIPCAHTHSFTEATASIIVSAQEPVYGSWTSFQSARTDRFHPWTTRVRELQPNQWPSPYLLASECQTHFILGCTNGCPLNLSA